LPKLSRLRFRFVLPIFVLGLSVLLTIKGDAYRQQIIDRVIAKYGHLEEPMPENVALGRFVSYAISAPAYVAARSIPSIAQVPHWQFLHGEEDSEHSAFLIVLWYIVGRTIDGAANPTAPMIRLPMWFLKAVQVLSQEHSPSASGNLLDEVDHHLTGGPARPFRDSLRRD